MHILILGGTTFVGRAAAVEALKRGHQVTLFNRGTHPTPPGAALIIGDRLLPDGHAPLTGKTFDAAIDTWSRDPLSRDPFAVRYAVDTLRGNVGHYVYVSTVSVYDDAAIEGQLNEDSPVVDAGGTESKYSSDKRYAELAALEIGIPVLVARPGLILRPHERSGRLPWWLNRLQGGGKTLGPGPRELKLQYIDARDLAAFVISGIETKLEGVYNCVSESGHTTMGELLDLANEVAGGKAELVWWMPEDVLGAGIKPWTEIPIWLPPGRDWELMHGSDVWKAIGVGLKIRPVEETVRDT